MKFHALLRTLTKFKLNFRPKKIILLKKHWENSEEIMIYTA